MSHIAMDYDDLYIAFRQDASAAGKAYLATVAPGGLLSDAGRFREPQPFTGAEIAAIQADFQVAIDGIHALAPYDMAAPPPDPQPLLDLGRRVAAVLPEQTRQRLIHALGQARRRGRGLRITLRFAPDAWPLLATPWEIMALPAHPAEPTLAGSADARTAMPLALNADVVLQRAVQGVGRAAPLTLATPPWLEVFVAAPRGYEPIDTRALRQRLEPLISAGSAGWRTGGGTLDLMQEHLRRRAPQIVHIICHGEQSDTGHGVRSDLILERADGAPRRASIYDLQPILGLAPDLQLVVLQACHSATEIGGAEQAASESIALGLLRLGVAAVLAFQGAVGQDSAGAFVAAFYKGLERGAPIEEAVSLGRIAMRASDAAVDWSLPVIFRGAEQPEPRTIFTMLADRIERGLSRPVVLYSLRAGLVALALLLLVVALVRWMLLPPAAQPMAAPLVRYLQVWLGAGLVCPAVVAALHRGARGRSDLPPALRRMALLAQWSGAYLGYALWGVIGLALQLVLTYLGVLQWLPRAAQIAVFVAVLVSALLMSYVAARREVQSVLLLGEEHAELFGLRGAAVIGAAALALLVLPLGLVLIAGPAPWFMAPAPGCLLLAIGLIAIVAWYKP